MAIRIESRTGRFMRSYGPNSDFGAVRGKLRPVLLCALVSVSAILLWSVSSLPLSAARTPVEEDVFLISLDPTGTGAKVYVNGELVGELETPIQRPGVGKGPRIHLRLVPGRYEFVVKKRGYRDFTIRHEIPRRESEIGDIGLHAGGYLFGVRLVPE